MRFVVLGDMHFATYNNPLFAKARDRVFEAFFRQVAELKADLVFAIGDTTQRGTLPEFLEQDRIAQEAGLKMIRLLGNHDGDSMKKEALAPFYLGDYKPASSKELYTSFTYGPARFVLLDTAREMMSSIDYSGYVSPEQLEWLEREIEEFNKGGETNYLVVMGHQPVTNTTHRSDEEGLNIANSSEVCEILQKLKRGTGLYFCGHNHTNSIYGPDEAGWYYIQAGAPLVCEGYRLVTADEKGCKVETQDFDLSDPDLRADFEATRYNFEDYFTVYPLEYCYGAEKDRNLFVAAT